MSRYLGWHFFHFCHLESGGCLTTTMSFFFPVLSPPPLCKYTIPCHRSFLFATVGSCAAGSQFLFWELHSADTMSLYIVGLVCLRFNTYPYLSVRLCTVSINGCYFPLPLCTSDDVLASFLLLLLLYFIILLAMPCHVMSRETNVR